MFKTTVLKIGPIVSEKALIADSFILVFGETKNELFGTILVDNQLPGALTLEQEFTLQEVKSKLPVLSLEELQALVIEKAEELMIKDNKVKEVLTQKAQGYTVS